MKRILGSTLSKLGEEILARAAFKMSEDNPEGKKWRRHLNKVLEKGLPSSSVHPKARNRLSPRLEKLYEKSF